MSILKNYKIFSFYIRNKFIYTYKRLNILNFLKFHDTQIIYER